MPIAIVPHGFIHAKYSFRRSQCQTNSVSHPDNPSETFLRSRTDVTMDMLLASVYVVGFLLDGDILSGRYPRRAARVREALGATGAFPRWVDKELTRGRFWISPQPLAVGVCVSTQRRNGDDQSGTDSDYHSARLQT